jgi:peptidyl-dipeptidase Dcp
MSQVNSSVNPLLQTFGTKYGAIPFPEIKTEDYLPALEVALKTSRANIEKIRDNGTPPDFENTIVALETATEASDLVAEIYFNLLSAEADEAMHALAKEISPRLADFSNDILLDEKLFERVKAVYEKRSSLGLTPEQMKLLEKNYKGFVRNGGLLDATKKTKLRELDQELSKLSPQFSENVLKATYGFELEIDNESDLKGLPESAIEAAALTAKQKGKDGHWIFTLEAPSYVPFLTYAAKRELREKLWRAYNSRAYAGPHDNREILKRIATLRHERAVLLGFDAHADYVLQERMAEEAGRVKSFMERLQKVAKPAADREIDEVRALMKELDGRDDLMSWDFSYYAEKLKERKFKFNEEELRPYFKLENVIQGIFEHARRLYGLSFKALEGIPVYHPDVKVFEVKDDTSGALVGLFYADFFPRPTKKQGAWMTPLREQGLFGGEVRRPHVAIVCNFTKPTPTKPSLLSFNEVRTLFHEFGHALHGLLSECTYRSVAGTNVYWDFVELPSQIMENWTLEKEALDIFAHHFETGTKIPAELTQKIKKSASFMAGYATVRQLMFGTIDMAWHAVDPSQVKDVEAFENKALADLQVLPHVAGTAISTSFGHIFAGGYSAGYYSYKWAEVLDADAFEMFKERGLFNREVAQSFRKNILSKGGTAHPMELYKSFRGREPDPDALLRRDGLI